MKKLKPIQKLISLLTAVAFMTGSLGFIGCGGVEEDPAAVELKQVDEDPDEGEDGQVDIDEAKENKGVIRSSDDDGEGADGDDEDE